MTATQSGPRKPDNKGANGTSAATSEATAGTRRAGVVKYLAARVLNPIIRLLAGKRHMRSFAVIEHRGRRSGRSYTTPVAARPTPDGFLVPMAFGEQADWFRNVQAAGGCTIRWNGHDCAVVDPEIIDWATAKPTFTRVERIFAPLFAHQFVRLRLVSSSAH